MIDPDTLPSNPTESQLPEQKSPEVVVRESNRDVVEAVYRAAGQVAPDAIDKHLEYKGVLRLVYDTEREEAEQNPEGRTVHPVIDTLSELVTSGKILRESVPTGGSVPKSEGDQLYSILDRAWGPVYAFTDAQTGETLAYSLKTDTHQSASTVLVSPEHIQLPEPSEQ